MNYNNEHRYTQIIVDLPGDQGGVGRHQCAGCAHEREHENGLNRREKLDLDLYSLPHSQAGTIRQKSPYAAYALGYLDGVITSFKYKVQL